ncbi:HTTM domain-containing protein [Singulisphaera sp. Ch08]|uniref:HTTM domain-containing protein n=1 Tax=Singulisphaera sp. Ch08 TaxID=3120278 RepID=A0AAU7CEA5_9BACT
MNPFRVWNRFWFGPISARPLGAFRIVFGLLCLANLAFMSFELDYWFTNTGLLQGTEAREVAGALRFSPLQWVDDPLTVRLFFGATAVVVVLFTVGWHTRIMGVLLYLTLLSIHHRNIVTNCGVDTLVLIMAFYAMLSPCGAAFSLDARRAARKRGTLAEPLIVPWAQRLIQLHLSLIYFDTAVLKCNGGTWLGGTALHFVLSNTEVGRSQLMWLVEYPLVINLLTYIALAVEFGLAVFLWFRPTRVWMALAGLGLHAGVLFTVNVPIFGEVMTACYLVFLAPDELNSLIRCLNPRSWFRRRSETGAPLAKVPGRVDSPSGLAGRHQFDPALNRIRAAIGTGEDHLED